MIPLNRFTSQGWDVHFVYSLELSGSFLLHVRGKLTTLSGVSAWMKSSYEGHIPETEQARMVY